MRLTRLCDVSDATQHLLADPNSLVDAALVLMADAISAGSAARAAL